MKTASGGLALHLLQPLTTMADCCRVEWQDGTLFGFTSFNTPLEVEGETYTPSPGMQTYAIQTQSGMAVDNTDIQGWIDDEVIRGEDIEDGLWDFADIRFFQVNWQDLSQGKLTLRGGWVGEIKKVGSLYVAEIRGRSQALVREVGDLYAPDCQADLGDARCKVDLAAFTVTGTVTSSVGDRRIFGDTSRTEASDWFSRGVLTWTSGANNGKRIEVEFWDGVNKRFALFLAMRHNVQIGDNYSVYAGCNKTDTDCEVKFANIENMRGFPLAPSSDALLAYPDSHL